MSGVAAGAPGQKFHVLFARWHGVDHQFLAALEGQYDGLEQPCLRVEPKPELTVRPNVSFQRLGSLSPVGCPLPVLARHPMLERTAVNFQAAKSARARRIVSERDRCSRSAT